MTALNAVRYCERNTYYFNEARDVTFATVSGRMVRRRRLRRFITTLIRIQDAYCEQRGAASPPEPRHAGEIELLADAARRPANRTPSPISAAGCASIPSRTALPHHPPTGRPVSPRFRCRGRNVDVRMGDGSLRHDQSEGRNTSCSGHASRPGAGGPEVLNDYNDQHRALRVKLPSATALARSRRRHSDVHPFGEWAPDAAELNTAAHRRRAKRADCR